MRKKEFRSFLDTEWSQNKRGYLLTGGLLILGIVIGCVLQSLSRIRSNSELSEAFSRFFQTCSLMGIEKGQVFRVSLLQYGKLLLLLAISGWSVFLLPLGFLQLVLKGTNLGFTAGYLISCFGFKGGLLLSLTVLPQQFLLLPVLCFYMVRQIQFAAERRQRKKCGSVPHSLYLRQLVCTLLVAAVLLLCSLMEGFAAPPLLEMLCGLLKL